MGSRYLTDLANVCRGAGLTVQEEPGWQSRSRSSGGYESGRPTHVMCHHTASNPSSDGQADVNYCCYGSADKPVANLYLSRSGKVWVMAAGATNTNGKGGPLDNVPADSMNTYAVAIEAANTGTGETWATAQINAYIKLVAALCKAYSIPNNHVRSHFEWTTRKIDPAGQSPYATGGNKWNMGQFRSDCAAGGSPGPGPSPEPGKKKLMYAILQDEKGSCWATNLIQVRYLYSAALITTYKNMLTVFGYGTTPTKVTRKSVYDGEWGILTGGLPGDTDFSKTPAGELDTWGTSVPASSGQAAGVSGAILQEIRSAVKK